MSEFENTNYLQDRPGNPLWKRGVSGNPAGRPPGARNKATVAAEALFDGEAETIARQVIDLAKEGDMAAIRLAIARICPPRRGRPVTFALPKLAQASDAVAAAAAIVEAVATGDLTPSEAGELSRVVSAYATTLQAADLDARLRKLEADRTTNRALPSRLAKLEAARGHRSELEEPTDEQLEARIKALINEDPEFFDRIWNEANEAR